MTTIREDMIAKSDLVNREQVLLLIEQHRASAERIAKERLDRGENASADIACGVMLKLAAIYKQICILDHSR